MKRVILASGICFGLIAMAMIHSSSERYVVAGNYSADTTKKPKPDSAKTMSQVAYLPDTTKKPKPDSVKTASFVYSVPDTTRKPKPDSAVLVAYVPDTTKKPKPDSTKLYEGLVAYEGR
ncbi:MAG: hypothetical protein P4L51_03260 [Puia sp.]|nr:hypothetical protein [Puia sp.]